MATPYEWETAKDQIKSLYGNTYAMKSYSTAGRKDSFRKILNTLGPSSFGVPVPVDINFNSNDGGVSKNYGYDLPCEFALIGCDLRFAPDQLESFISHSMHHFVGVPLPPRAVCVFCDEGLPSTNDLETNWRERMVRIGEHYQNGYENMLPDSSVIDYMHENGLITEEQYQIATKYTKGDTKESEGRRWLFSQDNVATDQMQTLEVGLFSSAVESSPGRCWHSRNVENRSLTRRQAELILAIFSLFAGFLMGASYLWLNKMMGLSEPSTSMNLMMNSATQAIPDAIKKYFEGMNPHLEGLIFGLFILATAALTGIVVAWAINKTQTRRAKTIGLIVIALSLVGGILIGVTAEELFLVCLPQGIGFGITCSWFLGCENVQCAVGEKEVDLMADF